MVRSAFIKAVAVAVSFSGFALAQSRGPLSTGPGRNSFVAEANGPAADSAPAANVVAPSRQPDAPMLSKPTLPRMAPELALNVYENRCVMQASELGSYSAVTTVDAILPDAKQRGEFELGRRYIAPHTMLFTPIRFSGDVFVKTNVITRLLQSEVEHLQKDQPAQTAINNRNYKISYKGRDRVNGRLVHVFHLKPRTKRPGLFKGRIFVDAFTGSLVRAEGRMVKSPSLFVKNIDFVQDYKDVGAFTFPVHMHSEAKARIIGRVVVDMTHQQYQPNSPELQQAARTVESAPTPNSPTQPKTGLEWATASQ